MQNFIENHTILFIILLYIVPIFLQIILSVIRNWDDLKIGDILCPCGWEDGDFWNTFFWTYFPLINTIFTLTLIIGGIYLWVKDMFDTFGETKFSLKIKNFLNKNIKWQNKQQNKSRQP